MLPRDSQTRLVLARKIRPRRAAILCWLIDHKSLWETLVEPEPGYVLRTPDPPVRLTKKGCKVVSAALKDAGFYARSNGAIEARARVSEARLVERCALRDRVALRRIAATYKRPYPVIKEP